MYNYPSNYLSIDSINAEDLPAGGTYISILINFRGKNNLSS